MLRQDYHDLRDAEAGPKLNRPQSIAPTTDPVESFVESRQVFEDFQVPGGTIRVDTRIKVSRNPWSVRSVVLENGTEVQEGPFAPIQQEFDPSSADSDSLEDLKLEFARQALAGHLARCKQVERALKGQAPSSGKGKGPIIAVVVALLLLVGGTSGFLLWKQSKSKSSHLTPAGQGTVETTSAPAAQPAATPTQEKPRPDAPTSVVAQAAPQPLSRRPHRLRRRSALHCRRSLPKPPRNPLPAQQQGKYPNPPAGDPKHLQLRCSRSRGDPHRSILMARILSLRFNRRATGLGVFCQAVRSTLIAQRSLPMFPTSS